MDDQNKSVYGFTTKQFEALPSWLQTFVVESNARNAETAHSHERGEGAAWGERAWRAADFILKLLTGLNGGALVAVLAFLGNLVGKGQQHDLMVWLVLGLVGFGLGLLCAIFSSVAAYFTSVVFYAAYQDQSYSFDKPFVRRDPATARKFQSAEKLRWVGIGLAIASVAGATCGAAAFSKFTLEALSRAAPERLSSELKTVGSTAAATPDRLPAPRC